MQAPDRVPKVGEQGGPLGAIQPGKGRLGIQTRKVA